MSKSVYYYFEVYIVYYYYFTSYILVLFFIFFFFFQAEDGIRDLTVTGVQTCALPIYTVACRDALILVDTDIHGFLQWRAGNYPFASELSKPPQAPAPSTQQR